MVAICWRVGTRQSRWPRVELTLLKAKCLIDWMQEDIEALSAKTGLWTSEIHRVEAAIRGVR